MPKVLGHGGRKTYRLTNAASRNAVGISARHLAAVRLPWACSVRGMNGEHKGKEKADDGAHRGRISGLAAPPSALACAAGPGTEESGDCAAVPGRGQSCLSVLHRIPTT